MRKTKVNKRKIKYSKKTRKNNNLCGKGVTDEVLRFRGLIKELKIKNKKIQKNKILPKDTDASTKGKEVSTKGKEVSTKGKEVSTKGKEASTKGINDQ